jgi:hypothetical protein
MDMDMSLSLGAAMGISSKNNHDNNDNNDNNSSFVDYSRRRSSVSTAILDTMRMFTSNARKNRRTRSFPKNEPRSNNNSIVEQGSQKDYDWSAHLRSAQAEAKAKHSHNNNNNNNNNDNSSPQSLLPRQKSEQDLIDEEENEFERAMKTLPKTNPANPYFHNSADTGTGTPKTHSDTKFNDSILDISGESFADPNAPDNSSRTHPTTSLPTNKARSKKSVLRLFSGSTTTHNPSSSSSSSSDPEGTKMKSSLLRKPTPRRPAPVDAHSSNGSVHGPLANLVALELNK